jgi:hypothetical protein
MHDYSSFEDHRVRHLEMIQGVISRLGTDSFLVKGWAVTLSGAFLGFAIQGEDSGLAFAGLLPALVMWGLDAYFLGVERLFRALHNAVRTGEPPVEPFFMAATHPAFAKTAPNATWRAALLSPTLCLFYGTLVVSTVVVAVLL